MRSRSVRPLLLGAVAAAALLSAACAPPPSPPPTTAGQRYVDLIFAGTVVQTSAYATTTHLTTGAPLTLLVDVYQPAGDTAPVRPAIVWIHGGGFRTGDRTNLATVAAAYARRGFVTYSIDYRLDPGNRCQEVQDGVIADPVVAAAERARCERAIRAAHEDALTAIRWVRANAGAHRVDPGRVAVGGGSAGAVTAINVAQLSNPGGGPVAADVRVGAALAMSGCQYLLDEIDAEDAPVSLLGSGGDPLIPYACVTETAERAESFGTPVQRLFHPDSSAHAQGLYRQHQAAVDQAWTAFLGEQLDLAGL